MKWLNNIWKSLEIATTKRLIPFVAVLGIAFITMVINGTLVAQLKGVNSLLHATTVIALLYVLFRIVKSFQKYIVSPQQVFLINKKKTTQIVVGSLLALTISFFCLCFLYLYEGAYTLDYTAPLLPAGSTNILLSFIAAAFFEELILRYFLLGFLLKNKWSFGWAIIVSSALFSYIHNYQSQSAEWHLYIHAVAFLLGVCFCLVYWGYANFWLTVFIHAIWNVINRLFFEEGSSSFLTLHELTEADNKLFFSIICIVLCSLIVMIYKKALKNTPLLATN